MKQHVVQVIRVTRVVEEWVIAAPDELDVNTQTWHGDSGWEDLLRDARVNVVEQHDQTVEEGRTVTDYWTRKRVGT